MIKRNSRNIGRVVRINLPRTVYHNRIGKVVEFRGDREKGDPWVEVFLYDRKDRKTGSVWPFSGGVLIRTK